MQLSDVEKFTPPLSPQHHFYQDGYLPALIWSRNMRIIPSETELGACLPIIQIAKAWLVGKGWSRIVSMEIFDWRMREELDCLVDDLLQGLQSWQKLVSALDKD